MVAEELDLRSNTLGTLGRLDPLAVYGRDPDGTEETPDAILGVGAVMLAHDGFDGLSGFFTMVEWHFGKVMVNDMRLDDTMHKIAANEAKVAVNRCGRTASEGPRIGIVMG